MCGKIEAEYIASCPVGDRGCSHGARLAGSGARTSELVADIGLVIALATCWRLAAFPVSASP